MLWAISGRSVAHRLGSVRPIPPLYPILDAAFLPADESRGKILAGLVAGLAKAGVGILQYRNKQGSDADILLDAEVMRAAAPDSLMLMLNDYVDLVAEVGFRGVHLGQTDIPPREARALLGPDTLIGISTHNEAQLQAAAPEPVDYVAIGPVFATASKKNPDPVVGVEGVRRARQLTDKPLVAIGGITLANVAEVWAAGADSVAVISGIFGAVDPLRAAAEFLRVYQSAR
jgi:thiamine-phosphate pyrophosphorylase